MYTILSVLILLAVLVIASQWFFGLRKLMVLKNVQPTSLTEIPLISIVVAAKNEQRAIRQSLQSMLNQTYGNMEIIAVNDRSTDATGEIINELAQEYDKLTPIHITEMPVGWLGKNHALYTGAKRAKGEWLLFMDGDVILTEDAIKKAVYYVQTKQLDHLTLLPENMGGSFGYRSFHSYWSIIGTWNFIQLGHAGVGAFNMVSRSAYDTIGTHKSVALLPDDDLKLGKKIQAAGFKQELGFGTGHVRIQWYENLKEVVHGLEKNLFAFMRYSFIAVLFFFCRPIPGPHFTLYWHFLCQPNCKASTFNYNFYLCAHVYTQP
ncbi:MAG: glycosyltransferase [Bacillus sp. (in: Bacteria)]|nr:glycosyltransferase [Bacillus sp. (in: firmicutes)]